MMCLKCINCKIILNFLATTLTLTSFCLKLEKKIALRRLKRVVRRVTRLALCRQCFEKGKHNKKTDTGLRCGGTSKFEIYFTGSKVLFLNLIMC